MPAAFAPGSVEPGKAQLSLDREDDPPPHPDVRHAGIHVPV